jgi:hypothetical protein
MVYRSNDDFPLGLVVELVHAFFSVAWTIVICLLEAVCALWDLFFSSSGGES